MTAHAAIAAVPKTGTPSRTLLQALLVSRIAWIVGSGESPADFDPRGEDGSPVTQVIGYNGLWFWYDEADSTTGHDGTTCIVTTATGGRYKVTGVDLLITSVISKTLTTPPDPDDVDPELRPSNGDAYIVPAASTGDWATWTGSIAVWVAARSEWFRITPKAGWFVSVPGATRDVVYHYDSVQADWITGDGATPGASTVPLSALIGFGLGPVRVSNQTTYAPPGSRKTGATPLMPLGGTASNINDNSDSTTAVTSALGDLSAAAFADRIVAQLTLAAATDLICIEVRGSLGSVASSASAMGLWYKSAGVWAQAGSGYTLSTAAQNIQRTGSFLAVTDIALVTEAKNWSTDTNTLAGLNAYDATVTGSLGDAFVIASPAFGVLAGHEGKVAICEVADTYTIYAPAVGSRVYDIALGIEFQWSGTAWISAAGSYVEIYEAEELTQSALSLTNDNSVAGYTYSASTAPYIGSAGSGSYFTETHTLPNVSADYAGQVFEVEYNASLISLALAYGAAGTLARMTAAIFIDSETNARDWPALLVADPDNPSATLLNSKFKITLADTSAHTIKIRFYPTSNSPAVTSGTLTVSRRRLLARKRA